MTERNDEHCCFICGQPFKAGEMVLHDVTEGLGHRACFGDDREGYVHLDTGAPLAERAPLPTGFPYDPAEFADPAPTEREVSSDRVSKERVYLIRKGGAWYRPDSAGYTTSAHEAGRYTLEEAEKITHPNGPNGPRDAMSYQHQDTVLALRSSEKTVGVKPLEWVELNEGKTFRALLPVIGSIRIEPYGVCGWWEVLWSMPGQCDKLIPDVFDTPDEAKAAAQADYERRILSAIESPAAAREVTDDMVERAHKAQMSELFLRCQPDRGDVFSFMDDRKDVMRAALTAALKGDRS